MSDLVRRVESSNLQHHEKSAIKRFYEDMMGKREGLIFQGGKHIVTAGQSIRQGGESILVGGLLGVAHCELKDGLDIDKRYPLDAAIGVAGLILGTAFAHENSGEDLRNAGASALSVFSFRKAFGIMAAKRQLAGAGAPGGSFHGGFNAPAKHVEDDVDNDPIVSAARNLRAA